jgi:hypothetical protein
MSDKKKDIIHTFSNGQRLGASQMAELDEIFLQILQGLTEVNEDRLEVTSIEEALIMAATITTGANEGTGALPSSAYILTGSESSQSNVFIAGGNKHETNWHKFARGLFAAGIHSMAQRQGHRFLVNIATIFGDLRIVDTPDDAGHRTLGDDEPAKALVKVTAFDLANDDAIRWWLVAGPTGDDDHPTHLLPITHDPGLSRYNWRAHWEPRDAKLEELLPPGIEDLNVAGSLFEDVDFRSFTMNRTLFEAGDLLDQGREEIIKRASKDMNIDEPSVRQLIKMWTKLIMERSKGRGGLKPHPSVRVKGIRA